MRVFGRFGRAESRGGQVEKSEFFADSGNFPANRAMFFGEKDVFTSFFS